MTTTPTAFAELPDLARLEALARAADEGEGQHIYTDPRDSNGWQANEAWHRAASPAAVLALIALARLAAQQAATPGAQLVIGVAAPAGAIVSIMQPHADGTITAIYGGTHPAGDSMGRAVVAPAPSAPGIPEAPDDDLYDKAVMLVRARGRASASLVQRTFLIGYNRASRLLDTMERKGLLSPSDENGHRSVVAAQLDGGQEGSESNG